MNDWYNFTKEEFIENMIPNPTSQLEWDNTYMNIAKELSQRSKCASRQVGCIIVHDNNILSIGINGSPSGSNLCQNLNSICPRKKLGFKSGEGVEYCPAQHAERNAITRAAKKGVSLNNSTLYLWATVTPCQQCAGSIINSGISRIVLPKEAKDYDSLANHLFNSSKIIIEFI
jgi:dCMP deaminase